MYKIIALIGKAGAGKDTILHEIIKNNPDLHEMISCTTRPKREGEVDGVNYFYLTPEQFLNTKMLESSCFNGWYYGTSYESLKQDKINIGVFNPEGINSLLEYPNIELMVYYITASPKQRLLRQLNRENNPNVDEIIRRYSTDEQDFEHIDFHYTVLKNEDENDFTECVELINFHTTSGIAYGQK